MSIQTQINRISANVQAALSAVAAKGVTVPAGSNSDDLAELIAAIVAGSSTYTVILQGAASEVVTYSGTNSGTVTLNTNGFGSVILDDGLYIFTSGKTGESKTVTVEDNTTVCMWPEGATAYFWHGWQLDGGWTNAGYSMGNTFAGDVFAGIEDNQIRVMANTNYRGAVLGTVNMVDLTNINTLYFELTDCSNVSYVDLGVTTTPSNVRNSGKRIAPSVTGASTASLDVSNLSGSYYIYVDAWKYDWFYANATFPKIWGV